MTAALDDAGLDPALADQAAHDDEYAERVAAEHRSLVEGTRSFGVPTIVLQDGQGPSSARSSANPRGRRRGGELFRHVVWLARNENFAELKRDRRHWPDLESVRRFRRGDGGR